jgi:hypothetical protein
MASLSAVVSCQFSVVRKDRVKPEGEKAAFSLWSLAIDY